MNYVTAVKSDANKTLTIIGLQQKSNNHCILSAERRLTFHCRILKEWVSGKAMRPRAILTSLFMKRKALQIP